MGHDVVGAVREQELALAVAIQHRRGIGVLALVVGVAGPIDCFQISLPVALSRRPRPPRASRVAFAVNELHVQPVAVEHGRHVMPNCDVELAVAVLQVELPDLLAVDSRSSRGRRCPSRPRRACRRCWARERRSCLRRRARPCCRWPATCFHSTLPSVPTHSSTGRRRRRWSRKMRSPQTTGVAPAGPGSGSRQATFSVLLHLTRQARLAG